MVGHKRERVLGRVGRAVNAAARDFAREAAQLENGGGREAAAERLVEQQVEVVALDKDRVMVEFLETAMRFVLRSAARGHPKSAEPTLADRVYFRPFPYERAPPKTRASPQPDTAII